MAMLVNTVRDDDRDPTAAKMEKLRAMAKEFKQKSAALGPQVEPEKATALAAEVPAHEAKVEEVRGRSEEEAHVAALPFPPPRHPMHHEMEYVGALHAQPSAFHGAQPDSMREMDDVMLQAPHMYMGSAGGSPIQSAYYQHYGPSQ